MPDINIKNKLKYLLPLIISLVLCSCNEDESIPVQLTVTTTVSETNMTTAETTTIQKETTTPKIVIADTTDTTNKKDKNEFSSSKMEEQYKAKYAQLQMLYSQISAKEDTPAINITTLDNCVITSKDDYVTSVVDVFNCEEKYMLSAECGVKIRGNSTATMDDEKPYRIKFTKKHNMLGLHDGNEYKSWVLLRTYGNLAPDYTAFKMAEEIFDGKYYSSDCTFVNLYINGEFMGIYLLCEQNQAANGRVDVKEPKKNELPTEIGYLLELDNYPDADEHPYFAVKHGNSAFTDINGETREMDEKCYSIKNDTTSEEQNKFIEKYTKGVFQILFEAVENNNPMMFDADYNIVSAIGTYTPKSAAEAVLDLESVANMLILEELVHDYDVGAGSFYMAVDFSENSKYERMTFLAPWDFNWCYYGETDGKYYAGAFQEPLYNEDRSNPWLTVIMKAEWFQPVLKEKWAELMADDSLRKVTAQVKEDVKLLSNDLSETPWVIDDAIKICDFVDGRVAWLDKQWR